MERSDALIKLVSVIVFVAVMIYLAVSFISGYRDPLRTVTATGMDLHDSVSTDGYIVRNEQVILSPGGSAAVVASEGAKVSAGQPLAVRYVGEASIERAERINQIQLRIRQLTALKNGKSAETLASETLLKLSSCVSSGELGGLYDLEEDVDAYMISGTATLAAGDEDAEIARLQSELESLSAVSSSDTVTVAAPWSGTFSTVVDGFESVGGDSLEDIFPEDIDRLFSTPSEPGPGAVGRLCRGIRWFYVTKLERDSAHKLSPGDTVKLIFSKNYSAELTMTVKSVSEEEDGVCAVVFYCDRFLQNVAGIREASAEIVFGSLSGVSVPREGVHLDENGDTVTYILEGATAHAVKIDIIAESGDYYMVERTHGGLREGDTVIVRANGLYDGAVVER